MAICLFLGQIGNLAMGFWANPNKKNLEELTMASHYMAISRPNWKIWRCIGLFSKSIEFKLTFEKCMYSFIGGY